MTASEFMAIAPMFASEDVTRPSLHEPFRYGDRLFVTDGRIALAYRARFTELCKIAETTDENRRSLGKSIMGMIESNDAKISSGKYQGFGLCSMMEAVIAAFANVEPEMMWLRANAPAEDDPDADGSPDSVRHVHESFTSVIMANPARSVIAGYYASLIAGLMKYHGPVEAYADTSDPHAMLYFRGPDWNCALMPRMVCSKGTSWEWNRFGGCSIADAWTGSLVYGRDEEGNPDMDALRKGVSARDFISPTAGRAVPSHAANGGIKEDAATATAARFQRNTPRRVAPTDAGIEPGRFFQPTTKETP